MGVWVSIKVNKSKTEMYDTILAKSFSRKERKKIGYWAFPGLLIIALCFFTVFKLHLATLPNLNSAVNSRLLMSNVLTMPRIEDTSNSQKLVSSRETLQESKFNCNHSNRRTDSCEIEGHIRVHGNSSTIFVTSSQIKNRSSVIRPYARKFDGDGMKNVKELSVKFFSVVEEALPCTLIHTVPAIVFSLGGYSGNHFHAFSDIFIPLFITSHQFNGEVQFLVTDKMTFWVNKYQTIFEHLSRYEIIDLNKNNEVHCFQKVILGLQSHKELSIDPSKFPIGYSLKDFTEFLRTSYSLKKKTAINIKSHGHERKPRLLIITRKRTRMFTNKAEIASMAKSLGFKVVVTEANSNLTEFAQIVNSCDVMMGVLGAGLTNMVFLPVNAILIAIIPLAGLEWFSRKDYEKPALDMNLRYLAYKIKEKESTLIEQYPRDHAVFKDPSSIHKQGWVVIKSVYFDKQNVKLDVNRFKATLSEAFELLRHD